MHIFFPVLYAVHTGNSSCQERYLLTVPESKLIFSFNRTSRQTGYYTTQHILFMGRTRRTKRLTQVREHWNIASLRRPHVWPYLAPVPLTPFLINTKFHQNVECCNLKYIQPITMKFCTHHDSYIVVTFAKLRCADATGTIESILQECTRPIWAIFIYIIIWWFCSQWSSGPTVSSRDMGNVPFMGFPDTNFCVSTNLLLTQNERVPTSCTKFLDRSDMACVYVVIYIDILTISPIRIWSILYFVDTTQCHCRSCLK